MSSSSDNRYALSAEKKLTLNGSAESYLAWLTEFQIHFGTAKDMVLTLQVCRNGVMPKSFLTCLGELHDNFTLAIAGSHPSVWSIPKYGSLRPTKRITVADYQLDKAQLLLTESLARSIDAKTSEKETNEMQIDTIKKADEVEFLHRSKGLESWIRGTVVTPDKKPGSRLNVRAQDGGMWTVENNPEVVKLMTILDKTLQVTQPQDAEAVPEGKRRHKTSGPSPQKLQENPTIRRDREKAYKFLECVPTAIAYFRASVATTAQPRLTLCTEFSEAEDNDDLLGAHCALMDLALFSRLKREMFAKNLKQQVQTDERYHFDPSRDSFADFSTLYINTFQIIKYADPKTDPEFIVDAMIANLPDVRPYDQIRRNLTTSRHVDDATEAAKHDLDKLVVLIIEELQITESLAKTKRGAPPMSISGHAGPSLIPSKTSASNTSQSLGDASIRELMLNMAAQLKEQKRQRPSLDETILRQCRNFLGGVCTYGDRCKYGHFNSTTSDPRVSAGKLLPAHKGAIEAAAEKFRADRKANKPSNNSGPQQATIMSLVSSLQATLARLNK